MSMNTNTYGGKYEPTMFTKESVFDNFLTTMIKRKCNRIDDLCNRLRVNKDLFMSRLNLEKFITNGYYIAPRP